MNKFPRLYVIADRATLDACGMSVEEFAREMADAGVSLLQYRDKASAAREVSRAAKEIALQFAGRDRLLVMNDRADLALLAGWGLHIGHEDLAPEDARRVLGAALIGVSTHNDAQVIAADAGAADYVAIGPVFTTASKADTQPVVGLEGVRRARGLTRKPLVAIGGIMLENARSVMDAGADSVAVIGGLMKAGERPGALAKAFLEVLG